MRKIINVLNSPFPYFLNSGKKNLILSLGVCVFLIGFMITFNPKAAHNLTKTFAIAGFTFAVLFPAIVLVPRLFPSVFDSLLWTFGKHLLFTIGLLLVIGLVITTGLCSLDYYPGYTLTQAGARIYPQVFTYGLVPITLVTLIVRNQMLRENLKHALRASDELTKIHRIKERIADGRDDITVIHSDTAETLELNLKYLLFVEANDNYSVFYWRNGVAVEKKILRVNLKNAENQLNNDYMIRCHRSFIVNVNVIDAILGNANGYKLNISGTSHSIPVSRKKGDEVIAKISQIRSVMELQ